MALPIHFVGSIPLSSTSETFKTLTTSLPQGTFKRLPDGETGSRHYFVMFQRYSFVEAGVEHVLMDPRSPTGHRLDFTAEEIEETMREFPLIESHYDSFAIESYGIFRKLRDEGIIPKGIKFQVGIPSTVNFTSVNIQPQFQATVEPHYEAALLRAIRKIQDSIPHEDLAIQIDMALDYCMLHGNLYTGVWYAPVFYLPGDDRKALKGILAGKVAKLVNAVDGDVEVGLHHCYGDMGAKHFQEPSDTSTIVEYHLDIAARITRPLSWIHLPVAKARDDIEYLEALRDLLPKLDPRTEVYLGLIHEHDLEGTQRKFATARKLFGERPFGVGTECGLGRRNREDLVSVLEIANAICGGPRVGGGAVS